jgi:transcriptional antiterminator NusG
MPEENVPATDTTPGGPAAQQPAPEGDVRRETPPAPEAAGPDESAAARETLSDAESSPVDTPVPTQAQPNKKHWYVVKVQSGREESIKEAIERRVKIEGLEEYYGQIVIPVERITEIRGGKRVQKERKLYPGYLMVEVEYNDRILYLFRETSGVGDFVGGTAHRPPPPMPPREVQRMLAQQGAPQETEKHAKPEFEKGDRVKVRDGTFAGMEGEVKEIMEAQSRVSVELTIFGRPVPVELEYWQVEPV